MLMIDPDFRIKEAATGGRRGGKLKMGIYDEAIFRGREVSQPTKNFPPKLPPSVSET